jgi:hypothetical protein
MIQGEDIKIRLTMTDGTNPIVPSTLFAYAVVVYFLATGKKTQIAKYESGTTGAYGIDVFNDVLGKIDIILNRELTPKIPVGIVYGEVWIKETASAEYLLSKSKKGVSSVLLFEMDASANANVT